VICCRCGAESPEGAKRCVGCGFLLPSIPAGFEVRPATSLLSYLRTVTGECGEGAMAADDFIAALAKVLLHMQGARADWCARLEGAPEAVGSDPRKRRTLEAMDLFIAAVEDMAAFTEDGDLLHLREGLEAAEVADMQLQDALRTDRDDVVSFRYSTRILPP